MPKHQDGVLPRPNNRTGARLRPNDRPEDLDGTGRIEGRSKPTLYDKTANGHPKNKSCRNGLPVCLLKVHFSGVRPTRPPSSAASTLKTGQRPSQRTKLYDKIANGHPKNKSCRNGLPVCLLSRLQNSWVAARHRPVLPGEHRCPGLPTACSGSGGPAAKPTRWEQEVSTCFPACVGTPVDG